MTQFVRDQCHRCGRRFSDTATDARQWNVEVHQGVAQWLLCPECQTPEEAIEAVVHEATLEYQLDTFGRLVARIKGTEGTQ